MFGGVGELRRQRIVLIQEPTGVGDQVQFMLAQLRDRTRPVDQGLQLIHLRQKQRLELWIERLRFLLELGDRSAELKGED